MTTTEQPTSRTVRDAVIGVAIGLGAHLVVYGLAFLAGALVEPGQDGWEDLVAVVGTLLVGEALVAVAAIVVGVMLIVRGRRALGAGLLVAWLVGAAPLAAQMLGITSF
jgi:hypothetical protein